MDRTSMRQQWDAEQIFNWALSLIITIVAVALHIHFLRHAGGLWRDEVNLINVADCPSFAGMASDSFPIMMPLMVHGWSLLEFGRTDFGLRCLGSAIGLGMMGVLWISSWTMHRKPPLLGLAFFSLNITAIIFGDSLRPYGLGGIFAIATVPAAWMLLSKPSAVSFMIFTLVSILGVQSVYFNIPIVFAACAGVTAACWQLKRWKPAMLAISGSAMAAATLLPYWAAKLTELNHSPSELHANFHLNNLDKAPGYPLVWLALIIMVLAVGFLSSPTKNESAGKGHRLFLSVTLLVAFGGFIVFCWLAKLGTHRWYYIPLMGLMAACFDGSWPFLTKQLRNIGLGFVLALVVVAIPAAHQDLRWRFTNVDLLAKQIKAQGSQGDWVIVSPWWDGITFNRYYSPPEVWNTLPPLKDHLSHRYDLVDEQLQNTNAMRPVLEKIASTLKSGNAVWLIVDREDWAPSEKPASEQSLPAKFDRGDEAAFHLRKFDAQIMDFLKGNSIEFGKATYPRVRGTVNSFENPNLFVAKGWSNQGSSPPPAK